MVCSHVSPFFQTLPLPDTLLSLPFFFFFHRIAEPVGPGREPLQHGGETIGTHEETGAEGREGTGRRGEAERLGQRLHFENQREGAAVTTRQTQSAGEGTAKVKGHSVCS